MSAGFFVGEGGAKGIDREMSAGFFVGEGGGD